LANPYVQRGRWPVGSFRTQRLTSGITARLDLGDRMQALTYLLRDYAPELSAFIIDRLPPGGVFFDVGSNIGLITFAVGSRRPDVAIHAFEPNPTNIAGWRANAFLNPCSGAVLVEAGVSERRGHLAFWIPSDLGSGMMRVGEQHANDIQVPTIRLDDYCDENHIDRIDVLKIDVQGHEPAVIRGAQSLLERGAIKAVVCELSQEVFDAVGGSSGNLISQLTQVGLKPVPIPAAGFGRLLHREAVDDVAYVT
jgi:FkbM family methyltransferase